MKLFELTLLGKCLCLEISDKKDLQTANSLTASIDKKQPEYNVKLKDLVWVKLEIFEAMAGAANITEYNSNEIGKALTEKLDNEDAYNIEALLPSNFNLYQGDPYNFKSSFHLITESKREKKLVEELNKEKGKTIIFENWFRNMNYPYIHELNVPYFKHGPSAYSFYNSKVSEKHRLQDLISGTDRHAHICVVLKDDINLQKGQILNDEEIKQIINSIETAYVAAYHDESYVRIRF
jgi:hypothetical protein